MDKPPFSIRQDPQHSEEYFALRDGIPDYLRPSLLSWAAAHYSFVSQGKRYTKADQLHQLERKRRQLIPIDSRRAYADLNRAFLTDDLLLLDAIDVVLQKAWIPFVDEDNLPADVETILYEGSSIYCVGQDESGGYELQRRQPKEMSSLVEKALEKQGRAADHLSRAWSKCFGRETDPNEACIEATKALEVAAKQFVTPDDPRTTLGKMCYAISDKPSKWKTDSEYVGGIQTVLHMMRLVWEGHLRHGDEGAPLDVSEQGAQMIVQTAVLLVTWFDAGRIQMKHS